jgi:hypothetical protein
MTESPSSNCGKLISFLAASGMARNYEAGASRAGTRLGWFSGIRRASKMLPVVLTVVAFIFSCRSDRTINNFFLVNKQADASFPNG